MVSHNPEEYGPVFADLLSDNTEQPLGPGRPNATALPALEAMTLEKAFAGRTIADRDMAQCAFAGVWLYHDFLDRSHKISQGVKTPTGSYWHGIMHRREPDYPNAKYWFGNAGVHPVFDPLLHTAAAEAETCDDPRASDLTADSIWDPAAFVDLCQAAADAGGELEDFCRCIQTREWWLLFDYCYHNAIARR